MWVAVGFGCAVADGNTISCPATTAVGVSAAVGTIVATSLGFGLLFAFDGIGAGEHADVIIAKLINKNTPKRFRFIVLPYP
jgi:hypothetical protein